MIHESHMCRLLAMILVMVPFRLHAQEPDREQVLSEDIRRLGERAVRDRIISEEERSEMIGFVRDSLPEGTGSRSRCSDRHEGAA